MITEASLLNDNRIKFRKWLDDTSRGNKPEYKEHLADVLEYWLDEKLHDISVGNLFRFESKDVSEFLQVVRKIYEHPLYQGANGIDWKDRHNAPSAAISNYYKYLGFNGNWKKDIYATDPFGIKKAYIEKKFAKDSRKKDVDFMLECSIQTIFFGAPGTGKSYKVNSILGEERKKCFAESSEIVKSNHYAEVLCDEKYIDCDIWIIDNIAVLEKKLAEFDSDDKRANPRHSALRAYIDFFKKYRVENRELRTTFHPDYDYAQFVGAYKPKKVLHCDNGLLSEEQLAQKLSEIFPKNGDEDTIKTASIAQFGLQYANSLDGKTISKIVKLSNIGDENYKSAILSAVVKARQQLPNVEKGITYSFVPQVFAKAYAAAWRLLLNGEVNKKVFLVIEEINRGNCAQIFGDIFQLLDRDGDGFSQYSIDADCDFAEWLETNEDGLKSVWNEYKEAVGEGKLKLPPNLNILATMNTSDQSLFPMDSAFKRRFDWEYVPISFDGKDAANFQIDIDGSQYSWQTFVETVNEKILSLTESEDKQLGEFFIKPESGNVISKDRFLGKVMFYLWNEVCKDEHKNGSFFRTKDGDKEKYFTFQDLYRDKGLLKRFIEKLFEEGPSQE